MKNMLRTTLTAAMATAALTLAHGSRADDSAPADSVDRVPVVTQQAAPEYPFSLRLAGNKGEVVVDFIIDKQGNVVKADVFKSSHPDFEAPAVEAVLKWKFKPGMRNGQPVFVHMQVPIMFQLDMGPGRGDGVEPWSIPEHASRDLPAEFQYDEAPKPLLSSAPVYPYDLLLGKVKGTAKVTFAIDPQGFPHVVKLVDASSPEFGAATSAMIEAWRFEPAKKGGKPCWAVLGREENFGGWSGGDFPVNESADRLLGLLRKDPSKIVTDYRSLDSPIKGRFTPSPVIPESVRTANVRAEAVIDFIVDHAGHAQLPQIISSTNPDFGWAAATAVGRWQYTAPSLNGRAVDLRIRVPLVYSPVNPPAKGS
jgi:TonB family protein